MYYDYRPMVTLGAVCIMEENGKTENSYAARAYRKGFEFLSDDLVDILAREAVDNTAILFKAIKPKGGEMPVVMGAGGSGILLHEAIGHAFEADFNRKNVSIFSDQLNKKVCNEHISVIDDGTIPFNRGSVNFDDEGVEGQKTYLVKEGVLPVICTTVSVPNIMVLLQLETDGVRLSGICRFLVCVLRIWSRAI